MHGGHFWLTSDSPLLCTGLSSCRAALHPANALGQREETLQIAHTKVYKESRLTFAPSCRFASNISFLHPRPFVPISQIPLFRFLLWTVITCVSCKEQTWPPRVSATWLTSPWQTAAWACSQTRPSVLSPVLWPSICQTTTSLTYQPR